MNNVTAKSLPKINWADEPSADDISDANAFLMLIGSYVDWTQAAELFVPAKDILRASKLECLPKSNKGVQKYLEAIEDGEVISRVLLMQGDYLNPLVPAEGFHRTCACYILNEKTPVGAFLG
jgi:hypothetical protein